MDIETSRTIIYIILMGVFPVLSILFQVCIYILYNDNDLNFSQIMILMYFSILLLIRSVLIIFSSII